MLVIAAIASVMIVSTAAVTAFNNPPISANAQRTACTSDAQCQLGVEQCIKGVCSKANPNKSEPQVCPSGFADCNRIRSDQCEVNLRDDNAHCGACTNKCEGGSTCQNGACKCPSGQQLCNGQCVDPKGFQSDTNNCGSCGNICPTPGGASSVACTSGQCGFTCGEGFDKFKDACLPKCQPTFERDQTTGQCQCPANAPLLSSDGKSCVAQCGTNEVEVNGRCAACAAQPGVVACGNACVNKNIDPANCGACGTACKSGEFCNAGVCAQIISCGTPGQTDLQVCNGVCTNTQTDTANCGACGNACGGTSGPAGSTCLSGACKCQSPTPFLSSDAKSCVASCGPNEFVNSAGTQCVASCGPNEFVNSAGKKCVAACGANEVPVADPNNPAANKKCTSCGTQTACNGACVNTQSNVNNCGACGTVCKTGETCNSGVCTPPPTATCSPACDTTSNKPICDTSGPAPKCVACTKNDQCSAIKPGSTCVTTGTGNGKCT